MIQIRLYPQRPVPVESFKGVKKVVVPNQSMTLHEIIQRFTRKEALPIEKEGFYAENLGDLEKMQREDITVRHERAAEISKATTAWKKREAEKEAAAKKKAEEGASGEPLKGATPPVQTPPQTPPPGPHLGSHT